MEIKINEFIISDDKNRLQLDRIYELLHVTYWAKERSRDTIEKSIANSLCFGIYLNETQVGFARCVTDYATIYWLADVIIDENYRKLGLGKVLVETIIKHEQLKGCNGILGTQEAHGLYAKYGFTLAPGKFMRKSAE